MESWQEKLLLYTSRLETALDKQRFKLKESMNWISPVKIQAYRGFAGKDRLYLKGRVLEEEGLEAPSEDATIWQNIKRLYHQFESDEIPRAKVEYQMGNQKGTLTCSDEGFFELNKPIGSFSGKEKEKWQKVSLRLLDQYNQDQGEVQGEGELMVPLPSNRFGLISDLDDTLIVSKATDFLEKMRILVLRNAHTRKPFEGVGAFYQALEAGPDKNCRNPVFYVSSSSWHLYEMFNHFCRINNIPKGVFLLQELGIDKTKFIQHSHGNHKLQKIKKVLMAFTDLPFVLVGDSGQKDPEIYREVVQQFPNRIKVIYIRDVRPSINDPRDKEVQQIAEAVSKQGVEMRLVQDSMQAARHAASLGLIAEDALEAIDKDTYEDRAKPSDISQLLGLDKLL